MYGFASRSSDETLRCFPPFQIRNRIREGKKERSARGRCIAFPSSEEKKEGNNVRRFFFATDFCRTGKKGEIRDPAIKGDVAGGKRRTLLATLTRGRKSAILTLQIMIKRWGKMR